jgi:hypothetical protein
MGAQQSSDQPATTFAKDQLKSIVERLHEERKATGDDRTI